MRLTQTNLILCSQDETAVSYSKLLLSLSNFEINYPFKNNLLLVHFELASKFFQQWKCSLKLKYAIANSYLFTVFRGSMPPLPLRMVMPTASHLKVKMQMKISDMKVAKGWGFYRIVCSPCPIWLLTLNSLRHWYSHSPHCSLYISYEKRQEEFVKEVYLIVKKKEESV